MAKEYWVVLSSGGLRIRQTPTLQGKPLGVLPNGSICISSVRQDNWLQHSQGWSMFENGDKVFARLLTPADYPTYEVVSKGGLRARETASAAAKETAVLATGSTVFCLEIQGFWIRHPEGWSMIHSDPSKGEKKIFLVEKKDAFLYPGGSPPRAEAPPSPSLTPVAASASPIAASASPVSSSSPPPPYAHSPSARSPEPSPTPEKLISKRGSAPELDLTASPPRSSSSLEVGRYSESRLGDDRKMRVSSKKEEATEGDLDAYRETLRAMCLDDRLSADELRFLAEMRRQRQIKEKQHFQVLTELGISKERFTAMIKNDREENKGFAGRSCVTCMDASADHVILRCFHLCLCEHCAGELRNQIPAKQKCPKCNAAFTEIQKVY